MEAMPAGMVPWASPDEVWCWSGEDGGVVREERTS